MGKPIIEPQVFQIKESDYDIDTGIYVPRDHRVTIMHGARFGLAYGLQVETAHKAG
jgi:hypothetical protein